jgi:hypothetical protein
MQNWTFNMSVNLSPAGYAPWYVTADPTNHLAAIVASSYGPGQPAPPQLASYTVDAHGDLSTTSTATNNALSECRP